ncbi:MAG: EFR1 family ferrodoxin [Bacteroidales bacterium]|nr:EFR1 family ferrodoxin [Bacteroidales bacterium]
MMKCLLLYFTGTFNTRYVSNKLKKRLENVGYEVSLYEIDPSKIERIDLSPYDLIGLGYPIYGFSAPYPFLKFVRKQQFPKGVKTFIYKNSGETEHENDASSMYLLRKLHRSKVRIENEYHFIMPYNIHFRFEENLVKEMLSIDEKLYDILVYEIQHDIPNLKPYKWWPRLVTWAVSKPMYIGGDVNSFLYKVDPDKCMRCGKCVRLCPMHNIEMDDKGNFKFHHHCNMCMRCSFFCPTNAFDIGFLDDWGWKVNGAYDFPKIEAIELKRPIITPQTEGFFHCYIETYQKINQRHEELFG